LEMRGQPRGEIERRRPADIVLQGSAYLALERGIGLARGVGFLQLQDQRHQRLGDETTAVDAEMPAVIGPGAERVGLLQRGHAVTSVMDPGARACLCSSDGALGWAGGASGVPRAASTKARIRAGAFSPGA